MIVNWIMFTVFCLGTCAAISNMSQKVTKFDRVLQMLIATVMLMAAIRWGMKTG